MSDPTAAIGLAPSLADLEAMALEALATLPDYCRAAAQAIALRVADFPTEAMMAEMEIEDPFEITGLYDGIPLTQKSFAEQVTQPDAIWLFRRPILEEWIERGDVALADLVAHVLVHELAHHFGWSDDDIAAIDRWWE